MLSLLFLKNYLLFCCNLNKTLSPQKTNQNMKHCQLGSSERKRFHRIVTTYKFIVNIYVLLKSFTFSFPLYISKFTFNKNIIGKKFEFFFSHSTLC